VYNLPVLLHLDGALDVGLLEQSLNHIIARHQILRTTFALQDGEPVQRIAPTLALPLVTLALSDAATLEMQINELVTAPFDLSRGPLLRAHLLRADATEQYLVFVFHHIISDGWSVNLFLKELGAIYQALQAGHEPRLPELPIQYSDYAAWQQRSLQGERLAELLQYWRQQLTGAPALLELPTDKPRPAVQRSRGAQVSLLLPPEIHEQLKALSQQAGVTMFMTLLAAFQVLLLRYSQQDQIVVGTPIAGRTQVETENLIGFFVNTLALRGDLSGNPSFQELLQRTRAAALGAYTHQELPFEKLVEELQPERSLSYTPLFQVMFALQNTPRVTLPLGDVKLTTIKLPSTTAKFDLSLDVYEEADGLRAWLEYDTDLFTAETAQRWLQQWQMLLAGIIQNPAQPIHALPLTLNGKVNRKALPVAQEMRPAVAAQYVAPRTPTEEAVATIWGTLLKLNRVGVHDNFFDLGGHSLLATKVVARLQERFAVKMPLRTLFEMPTVAAIASALEDLVAAATEEDELAALLAELEEMSEDDAQQLLTAMSY
jgi:acyl carrier protein